MNVYGIKSIRSRHSWRNSYGYGAMSGVADDKKRHLEWRRSCGGKMGTVLFEHVSDRHSPA